MNVAILLLCKQCVNNNSNNIYVRFMQKSPEYGKQMKLCHQRAADRLLKGCLLNGGLYVKLGQGLVSFGHLLPREYICTLEVLQDKALRRRNNEVILRRHCVVFASTVSAVKVR